MDNRAYWIWMQHAFTQGSSKPKSILNRFSSIKEFYEGGLMLWSSMKFFNESEITFLANYTLEEAEITLEYCEKLGQTVLTPECSRYPDILWNIYDPPSVLYMRGVMPRVDDGLAISVVGSRKADKDCLFLAENISYELSKNGIYVVSGGAIGVDTAAHRGAIKGGSPTIAFLGCGLDYPYLMENQRLRQRIVEEGGAVITEYPPSMGVQKGTFQARNRLISGMSKGTLIVSAAEKSGTMITARRALEQDRDIFAIPGSPLNKNCAGTNALIRDGATPVTKALDIIDAYGNYNYASISSVQVSTSIVEVVDDKKDVVPMNGLSTKAVSIFKLLTKQPKHISDLVKETGFKPNQILAIVTELEINDLINTHSGQRYSLK